MKPDWKKIKLEYISGKSREEICKEYGIKYRTLDSKIVRGKWNEQCKKIERKVQEKIEAKVSESIADTQAKFIKKQFEFFDQYFEDEIKRYKALKHSPDYRMSMTDLKEAVRMARQAINLFDSKTENNTNVNVVNKYKELSIEEIEQELARRGLPTKLLDE